MPYASRCAILDVDRVLGASDHSCCCAQPFTLVGSGRVGKALADLGTGDDVRRLEIVRARCSHWAQL